MTLNIEEIDHYNKLKSLFDNRNYNVSTLIKEDCLKEVLKENITYPNFYKPSIVLDRNENIRGYEALIGMSYDYAIRFLFAHKEDKKIDKALFDSIGFQMESDKKRLLNNFDNLYKNNKIKAIIDLSFKLSLNETEFRSGEKLEFKNYPKEKLNHVYKEIEEVLKLSLNLVKEDFKHINYNPVFGNNRLKADGDIIIDNTLIDFKVVSSLNDFRAHLDQMVLYCILAEGLKQKYNENFNIEYIQIYYPRFNVYPKFKVSDLISKENINKILKYLP